MKSKQVLLRTVFYLRSALSYGNITFTAMNIYRTKYWKCKTLCATLSADTQGGNSHEHREQVYFAQGRDRGHHHI